MTKKAGIWVDQSKADIIYVSGDEVRHEVKVYRDKQPADDKHRAHNVIEQLILEERRHHLSPFAGPITRA